MAAGDLLTVPQVLAILPVGRSTLYQLVDEGQIPAVRIRTAGSRRGRILVHRADLDAFIDRSRPKATSAPTRATVDDLLKRVRNRA